MTAGRTWPPAIGPESQGASLKRTLGNLTHAQRERQWRWWERKGHWTRTREWG